MSDLAIVAELPVCDPCHPWTPTRKARYDARLSGMWGNYCADCFRAGAGRLGTGCGQELRTEQEARAILANPRTSAARRARFEAAMVRGGYR